MNMSNEQYNRYVDHKARPSPIRKNVIWAFLVGGAICCGGQGLSNLYQSWGADTESAGAWVSVTMIFLAAFLTGLGVFDDIARRAGAGTLVPITGFANAVVSPAIEFKAEGYITGVAAKMFIIAGPVIVYGILASVVYGALLYVKGRFGI